MIKSITGFILAEIISLWIWFSSPTPLSLIKERGFKNNFEFFEQFLPILFFGIALILVLSIFSIGLAKKEKKPIILSPEKTTTAILAAFIAIIFTAIILIVIFAISEKHYLLLSALFFLIGLALNFLTSGQVNELKHLNSLWELLNLSLSIVILPSIIYFYFIKKFINQKILIFNQ